MKPYVETTVPSFFFADDAPEKKAVTIQFYNWIKVSSDGLYIPELVLAELNRAPLPLRTDLLNAAARLEATVLPITVETEDLARRYLSDGVIPTRYRDDAPHQGRSREGSIC